MKKGLTEPLRKNTHTNLSLFSCASPRQAPFSPPGTIHTPLLADMPVPSFTDDREDWSAHGGDAAAAGARDPGSLRRFTSFRDVRWPEEDKPREKIEGWWRGLKDRCVGGQRRARIFFGGWKLRCHDPPALPPPRARPAPRFVSGDWLNR